MSEHHDELETDDPIATWANATPPGDEPAMPPLPEIEVTTDRHIVLDEAIAALAEGDPDLYQRGGKLVTVRPREPDPGTSAGPSLAERTGEGPAILQLSEAVIGTRLTATASYYTIKRTRQGEEYSQSAHPPEWLIAAVASRQFWPDIRSLVAVADSPFPRPDGTLVEAAGYDPDTGVLLRTTIDFHPVPESPDREQAVRAWDRLKEYVADFPFEGEDDRAVFLAGLLTVIARPAIDGPVPGIAVIGNRAGTGKALLIDVMAIPGTGRCAPTSSYPDDAAEATKVKTAIALGGDPVVHFDNLAEGTTYGNSALDSALTAR
jgi:putative DNA primase/helicase